MSEHEPPEGFYISGSMELDPEVDGSLVIFGPDFVLPVSAALIDPEHGEYVSMVLLSEVLNWLADQREAGHYPDEFVNMAGTGCAELLHIIIESLNYQIPEVTE